MKEFKLKTKVELLKESIEIDPSFNINPILQKYLVDDFPINNFFDYKYSGEEKRIQYKGKDVNKALYHFVGANGEAVTFEEEVMLKHILNNNLIPEVVPVVPDPFDDTNSDKDKKDKTRKEEKFDKVKFSALNDKNKEKFKADNIKDKTKFPAKTPVVKAVIINENIDIADTPILDTHATKITEHLSTFIDGIKGISAVTINEFSLDDAEYPYIKFSLVNSETNYELSEKNDVVKLTTDTDDKEYVFKNTSELVDLINSFITTEANVEINENVSQELTDLINSEDISDLKNEDLEMLNNLTVEDFSILWKDNYIDKSISFDEILEAMIELPSFKSFSDTTSLITVATIAKLDKSTYESLSKQLEFSINKEDFKELDSNDYVDYFDSNDEKVSDDPNYSEITTNIKSNFSNSALKKLNSGSTLTDLDAIAYIELSISQADDLIYFLNYNKVSISIKKK